MVMNKIHVYFMPGLAASSTIFERIQLPTATFEIHLLDWKIPHKNETLVAYAKRMAAEVPHDQAVLVGVSFGGVLVQEMATFLQLRKLIIVSGNSDDYENFKINKSLQIGAHNIIAEYWSVE